MDTEISYINILKEQFFFLLNDFSYNLEKENNDKLYKAISFLNKKVNRSLSIVYDIRNCSVDVSIWKLKNNERDVEDRSSYIYLADLLEIKNYKRELPKLCNDSDLTEMDFKNVISFYVKMIKEYTSRILEGKEWIIVPWLDSFNDKYKSNS